MGDKKDGAPDGEIRASWEKQRTTAQDKLTNVTPLKRDRVKILRCGNELHAAMEVGDWVLCESLIRSGRKTMLTGKNKSGCTALMLAAMGKCPLFLLELMLEHGAAETASQKRKHKTAADYAEFYGKYGLAEHLRRFEVYDPLRTCDVCGERAEPRNKLHCLADLVAQGKETNPMLIEFFTDDAWTHVRESLGGQSFHTLTGGSFSFRKELSETMGVLSLLEGRLHNKVHLIDLLCGKSMTTAVAALKYGCPVTAADKLFPNQLPHYESTQLNVTYIQGDVFEKDFVDRLRERISAVGLPAILLSIHCCGLLGMLAVDIFHRIDIVEYVVLVPCCLPRKSDPRSPQEVFEPTEDDAKFFRWAEVLRKAVGPDATLKTEPMIMSARRLVIEGRRSSRAAR